MATDIATLGIKVQYSTITQAGTELDKLTLKSGNAEKATNGLAKSSDGASRSMMAYKLAAIGVATAVFAFVKNTIDAYDELSKLSTKLGASTEALSQYKHIADLSGISFEQLTRGWQYMTRGISDATRGTGEAKDALIQIGLSADALIKLKPEDQYEEIAKAMEGVALQSDKVSIAARLFGARNIELLETMKDGKRGLIDMREEADALGQTISGDTARAAEEFNDSLTRIKANITGAGMSITSDMIPALQVMSNTVAQGILEFADLGNMIGAAVAAAISAVTLDFAGASAIMEARSQKRLDIEKQIAAIWAKAPPKSPGAAGSDETQDDGKGWDAGWSDQAMLDASAAYEEKATEAALKAAQERKELLFEQDQDWLEYLEETEAEYKEGQLAEERDFLEELERMEKEFADESARTAEEKAARKANAERTFWSDATSLMQSGNKKMFAIGKAAALASAIIDGHKAALSAWRSGMETAGPWAPAVAAAYTAASLAKTGMLISSISSASPSGSGSSSSGGGGGIPSVSTPSGSSNDAPPPDAVRRHDVSIVVSGGLHDDEAVRNLINRMNEIREDMGGNVSFVPT